MSFGKCFALFVLDVMLDASLIVATRPDLHHLGPGPRAYGNETFARSATRSDASIVQSSDILHTGSVNFSLGASGHGMNCNTSFVLRVTKVWVESTAVFVQSAVEGLIASTRFSTFVACVSSMVFGGTVLCMCVLAHQLIWTYARPNAVNLPRPNVANLPRPDRSYEPSGSNRGKREREAQTERLRIRRDQGDQVCHFRVKWLLLVIRGDSHF